ncbi:MAG: sulfate adenylyltransferase subunit CysN [Acidobacteria bacterium]|nr:MAG: sulfate adenylyltransferase subunit CysN [Acidobacteriota bacterium]
MRAEAREIVELFEQDQRKDLLRFVTCGSVDDGKSTLIGRLLYESKGIYEDQLEQVRSASAHRTVSGEGLDLALVTDGLRAEREQGITIDVAYRYFSTPRRKFIIADTPGHEQYTRNMATGASTADLAVLLIDASQGVLTQSRRHAFIASLLRIPHVVVAVNKMDLVGWDEQVFRRIVDEFSDFCARLELTDLQFIPISALRGDNVVRRSDAMAWYDGPTLLGHLETVHIASDRNLIDLRFPVQYVSRPSAEFRGYMGTPASGIVRPGDAVRVLPSGTATRVREVLGTEGPLDEAFPPVPCTLTLADEVDVSRGDLIVHENNVPRVDNRFDAMLVWMAETPLALGERYTVKHLTRMVPARVATIRYRIDVNTLHRQQAETLGLNEIGRVLVELERPLAFDAYKRNRQTGAFIVIDRLTNNTVGAGMILDRSPGELSVTEQELVRTPRARDVERHAGQVSADERRARLGHGPATVWLTGLVGAGKTTIAYALERRLFDRGVQCAVLDGENARLGLSLDLGFSARDRAENIRRAAEAASLLNEAGLVAVCAFLSPNEAARERAREIVGDERFVLVHLDCPLDVCRQRARDDLYGRAERGELKLFPGVSASYERPGHPDLVLRTDQLDVDACVDRIVEELERRGILPAS